MTALFFVEVSRCAREQVNFWAYVPAKDASVLFRRRWNTGSIPAESL
jgi:hypothetical protein